MLVKPGIKHGHQSPQVKKVVKISAVCLHLSVSLLIHCYRYTLQMVTSSVNFDRIGAMNDQAYF